MDFWLVVWNIFYFPYIGNNHPNRPSYFSDGWLNHKPDLCCCETHQMRKPSGGSKKNIGMSFDGWSLSPALKPWMMVCRLGFSINHYPLVNVYRTARKISIFDGKINYKWLCPKTMLVYQRVKDIEKLRQQLKVGNSSSKSLVSRWQTQAANE